MPGTGCNLDFGAAACDEARGVDADDTVRWHHPGIYSFSKPSYTSKRTYFDYDSYTIIYHDGIVTKRIFLFSFFYFALMLQIGFFFAYFLILRWCYKSASCFHMCGCVLCVVSWFLLTCICPWHVDCADVWDASGAVSQTAIQYSVRTERNGRFGKAWDSTTAVGHMGHSVVRCNRWMTNHVWSCDMHTHMDHGLCQKYT